MNICYSQFQSFQSLIEKNVKASFKCINVKNESLKLYKYFFFVFADGQQIWEFEATVDKDKSQAVSLHVKLFIQSTSCLLIKAANKQKNFVHRAWCSSRCLLTETRPFAIPLKWTST